MKHLLLVMALTLVGCGGGSSTTISQPIEATEPVEVTQPIVEVPKCPEVPECPPCPEVTEVEPEIVTYHQLSTHVENNVTIQETTYNDEGYVLTDYYSRTRSLRTYEYDENNNNTLFEMRSNGELIEYTYRTFDDRSNILTSLKETGRHEIYTYDEYNHKIKSSIYTTYEDAYMVTNFTWEGDNLIREEHEVIDYVYEYAYDENGNMIKKEFYVMGELIRTHTYIWEEFTEEIK